MKKIISILILFSFLFSTIGVIANSYHCKMVMPVGKSCCKPVDRGCCEKDSKLLKLTDHFVAASSQVLPKLIQDFIYSPFSIVFPVHDYIGVQTYSLNNHAPPESPVALILVTQSFRI